MSVSMQKTFSNTHILKLSKVNERKDFSGGSIGKNLPAKAGTGIGLIPGRERFHTPESRSRGTATAEPAMRSSRSKSSGRSEE